MLSSRDREDSSIYRVLHAMMWVVSLGNGMFFSVGWILFVWHLTDSFRHINYAGWIIFFEGLALAFLLPLWFVRGLLWGLVYDHDRSC
jgi:hypothetical protein